MTRVAILGAGPAGMSCALWLKNLGCHPLLIDSADQAGGLLRQNILKNDWVLGHYDTTGHDIARQFGKHIQSEGIETLLNTRVRHIAQTPSGFALTFDGTEQHRDFEALVLATGTRPRGWEAIPAHGAEMLETHCVLIGPAAFGNSERFSDQRLLVVGGGDNAHEFVRLTADHAAHQTLLVRAGRRAQQAQSIAVNRLIAQDKAAVLTGTIQSLRQEGAQIVVGISMPGAAPSTISVDRIILQLGYTPNVEALLECMETTLRSQVSQNAEAYLSCDPLGRTGCPGLYAIGDLTNPFTPSVVTALAAGANAARDIERLFRT